MKVLPVVARLCFDAFRDVDVLKETQVCQRCKSGRQRKVNAVKDKRLALVRVGAQQDRDARPPVRARLNSSERLLDHPHPIARRARVKKAIQHVPQVCEDKVAHVTRGGVPSVHDCARVTRAQACGVARGALQQPAECVAVYGRLRHCQGGKGAKSAALAQEQHTVQRSHRSSTPCSARTGAARRGWLVRTVFVIEAANVALHYCAVKEALCLGRREQDADGHRARTLSEDCHRVRVTTHDSHVALHPLQCRDLVLQAKRAVDVVTARRKVPKGTEAGWGGKGWGTERRGEGGERCGARARPLRSFLSPPLAHR